MNNNTRPSGDYSAQIQVDLHEQIERFWIWTKQREWVLHLDIPAAPKVLYQTLLSTTWSNGQGPSVAMTYDEIRYLATTNPDKPVSERNLRNWIKVLKEEGLIIQEKAAVTSTGRGGIRTETQRTYTVRTIPPESFQGWTSTKEKRAAYRPNWEVQPPVPSEWEGRPDIDRQDLAGRNTPDGFDRQNPSNARQDFSNDWQNPAIDRQNFADPEGLTSRNGAPKKTSKKTSKTPPQDCAEVEVRKEPAGRPVDPWVEEDAATPPKATPAVPSMAPASPEAVQGRVAVMARQIVDHLVQNGLPVADVTRAARGVEMAISLGHKPVDVAQGLKGRMGPGARDKTAVVLAALRDDFGKPPVEIEEAPLPWLSRDAVRIQKQARHNCRICRDTSGFVEGEGVPVGVKCAHERLLSCRGCRGTNRMNGKACMHVDSTGPESAMQAAVEWVTKNGRRAA